MHLSSASTPAPHRRAGCRETTAGDRHSLPGRVDRRAVIVGDPHPPATFGRFARAREIAAEPYENTAVSAPRGRVGGAVRTPCFGRCAEVDLDAVGHAYCPSDPVHVDPVPSRDAPNCHMQRRSVGIELSEISVVADLADRGANSRVDESACRPRAVHRNVKRVEQPQRDDDFFVRVRVHSSEVRVISKPAAGTVNLGDDAFRFSACNRQCRPVSDEHDRGRPQRGKARLGDAGDHDWPDTTTLPPPES